MSAHFPPPVTHKLGYYVYLYINPLDEKVFYVGKGKGNRAFAHLDAKGSSTKAAILAEIRAAGQEPRIEILVHGLKDEETAFKIEAAVIDLLGPEKLANEVRGYHSRSHGRMKVAQIRALYGAKRAEIVEPTLLVRIKRLYRHTMTPAELYETTRGYWNVGPDRKKVQLVMAVYASVVREVYEVQAWYPAGSTFTTRTDEHAQDPDRWEFVGRIAADKLRKKYLYRSVAHLFDKASQNPILYVNVD